MKAKAVLDAVQDTSRSLPKGERAVLNAFIEDMAKMDNRMTALENTVKQISGQMSTVITEQQLQKKALEDSKASIDRLSGLIEASIKSRDNKSKTVERMINNKLFWIWLCILTMLVFGVTGTELGSILHFNW